MTNWRRIESEEVDQSILERISEDDVQKWLAAKFRELSATGLPLTVMSVDLWPRRRGSGEYFDSGFNIHAIDAISHLPSMARAIEDIRTQLLGDPARVAAEKKRLARELLAEADKLDALAQGKGAKL